MARQVKRRTTPGRIALSVLKILYLLLFIVCALIVVLYFVFKTVVKPPAVDTQTEVVVTVRPTDDPATPDVDESQQTDAEPATTTIQLTRKDQFFTFLLMGSDDGNGNADTIMVGSYDVKNNKISVISVPRDTLVDVKRTVKKIGRAHV